MAAALLVLLPLIGAFVAVCMPEGSRTRPAAAGLATLAAILLVLGASIILIGALGLLRLRTFYQRIHGPAIAITLGAGSVLLASMLYFTAAQSPPSS